MATMPLWLRGRDCVVSITPATYDPVTGVLTTLSAQSLAGRLETIDIDAEVQHEEISPMDVNTAHHTIVLDDFSISLTEILSRNAVNLLAWFSSSYDHAYFLCVRGLQAWGLWAVRGSYNESLAKQKSTGRLTVRRININGYSPSYASGLSPNPGYGTYP